MILYCLLHIIHIDKKITIAYKPGDLQTGLLQRQLHMA